MTHRGPFQPLLFCDSVILCHRARSPAPVLQLNEALPSHLAPAWPCHQLEHLPQTLVTSPAMPLSLWCVPPCQPHPTMLAPSEATMVW